MDAYLRAGAYLTKLFLVGVYLRGAYSHVGAYSRNITTGSVTVLEAFRYNCRMKTEA